MGASSERHSPAILFAVTEDWYFWSHRKPLADYLRKQGCAIAIATRFNQHETRLSKAGFQCIALPFERSLAYPLRDLRAAFGLWLIVRRLRPDVVHLVSLKPILLSSFTLAVRRRTRFVAAFTGMGYLFSSRDRRARWFQRGVVTVLRMALRRSNVSIVVQNAEDRALLETEGLGVPERTILIPGVGVDIETFAFAEVTIAEAPLVVLPARLIRDKGVEEFVAAARIVKQARPETRMVLVGAADPDNPAAIPPAVIDAWAKEGVVEWWGHRQDMPAVYREAQLVCLPSYREGLPKVLMEAAACGRPLVASDVAGCREVCRDGVNGTLVPPRSPEALAAAIVRLLESPDTQRSYGLAGREIVEREYSVEQIGQETLACYRQILTV
ncbi:MAG TPA: glycosyltransferase family 4 protein [Gammaproteobacteria bacterium]|nr:glycosyltransferase family 4 protein [Gammaproteobacteria bacterium]